MSDIAPIGPTPGSTPGPTPGHHVHHSSHRDGHPQIESADRFSSNSKRSRDRVELSDQAKLLERMKQLPDVRQERIDAAREAIASGRYESEDRINKAIENLMQDLEERR